MACKKLLDAQGIEMARGIAGEFLTVQEMGGFQMILCKLDDDHADYLKAPAQVPYWNA